MKGKPSKPLENLMFSTLSRNAKPDNDSGILMIGGTKMNWNSIDLGADKLYIKNQIHYNGYYSINRCADFEEYTGTTS